ncbi:MAG TPA: CehA/McbA family metallohydrolase [Chitinophagaceae bacterium]|nr:CehA/McbA family metallohydrolase [Chitinophagaceae bacterium]
MKAGKLYGFLFVWLCCLSKSQAQANTEFQPFIFKTKSIIETLDFLGSPLSSGDNKNINAAIEKNDAYALQKILDKYVLFAVNINPESRVKAALGEAKPVLHQNGWTSFLIKVQNDAGITAQLKIESEQAKRDYDGGEAIYGFGHKDESKPVSTKDILNRWLDMSLYSQPPMQSNLSGLQTEYFILQLYSRDSGKRAARFSFNCGQATQDLGFRNEADALFDCLPSQRIKLQVLDENNKPSTASFIIKDKQNHIYPSQYKRLAPDFFFQPQVYRTDGETIDLPVGDYKVEYGRGPEYFSNTINLFVKNQSHQILPIHLQRWIDPSKYGWYSGDHHIHAAGCSHYTTPTEGVTPADMMRHILGEAVNVGSVLTWGPGYYHQKQFFEGKDNVLSTSNNIMRYDLEISGFPSSHAGHLVLLRLKEQDYPGTKVLEDWPTWTIPILKWAKAQGAITGYAHSGLGLEVSTDSLPNYEMPRFDGIGANEYIVAVTQNLVDFISTMDTPPTWELNIWYHTLNCGYRTRISGETDFPCMSDDKVAHGRSYVKMNDSLNFDEWTDGIQQGRAYVSEGKSHLMNFMVNNVEVGTNNSEVNLVKPSTIQITVKVAAMLSAIIDTTIHPFNTKENPWRQKPFWNIERARIGKTRTVPVELVVNGKVVAVKNIVADGSVQDISFETFIDKSSWVALRILPSSHTNPVFVIINNQPIRASKQSAEWCLKAVDVCWNSKSPKFSAAEKNEAAKVYAQAREAYRKIISECDEK